MSPVSSLALVAALLGAGGAAAQSFPAPAIQTMPRPTPDADALADAMRRLGSNPRDLASLITAAELSLKLGDVSAAAALLKRAEEVDPMNGRVKAGMARILVSQERPGEALRYFDQAAGYGLDPRSFAGDRGLAYDLIGEQERAQRDYRTALKLGGEDEVQRRYALSLGISGKREAALEQIDALLRKSDRGAWRARAFVLAMTGDVAGAEKIATTMMPPGLAAGLQPFFVRLAALAPADRAFAVHFGELRSTPQRVADRRLTPALPALLPEAAPVQLAQAAPTPAPARKLSRREERELARQARLAARARRDAPVRTAALAPRTPAKPSLPAPPAYGGGVAFAAPREVTQAIPSSRADDRANAARGVATAAVEARPAVPAAAVQVASNAAPSPGFESVGPTTPATVTPVRSAASPVATAAAVVPPSRPVGSLASTAVPAAATVTGTAPVTAVAAAPVASASSPSLSAVSAPVPAAAIVATTPPTAVPSAALSPLAPATTVASAVASPSVGLASTPAAPSSAFVSPAATVAAAAPPRRMREDTILARIMAGISIPAEELGVAPMRRAVPAPVPAPAAPGVAVATPASIAAAKAAERAAAAEARKLAAAPAEPTRRTNAAKSETPAVDPKVAARKAAAEKKAAEAKKLADAKKAEEKKKAAELAREERAQPSRIWVQVAGGAQESDLPKAWAAAQGKAAALKGRAGYTTPLRATNRVVTGPFKTDAEARAFVNTLAKQGISAFPFTSTKGQKITKLGGK